MLSAAREAIRNGAVAVAPTSDFHHAGHCTAAGFCTFNGFMVTALALKAEGLAERVGILDLDHTTAMAPMTSSVRSINVDFATHFTSGAEYLWESQADESLQRIPRLVASIEGLRCNPVSVPILTHHSR